MQILFSLQTEATEILFPQKFILNLYFFWFKIEDSSYLNTHYTEEKNTDYCYRSTKMPLV